MLRLSLSNGYHAEVETAEANLVTGAPVVARPLSTLKAGQYGLVTACRVEGADAPILRAMGLTEGAVVRVTRVGEPTIVALLCHRGCHCSASRVGLARALADRVLVTEEPAPVGEAQGAGQGGL